MCRSSRTHDLALRREPHAAASGAFSPRLESRWPLLDRTTPADDPIIELVPAYRRPGDHDDGFDVAKFHLLALGRGESPSPHDPTASSLRTGPRGRPSAAGPAARSAPFEARRRTVLGRAPGTDHGGRCGDAPHRPVRTLDAADLDRFPSPSARHRASSRPRSEHLVPGHRRGGGDERDLWVPRRDDLPRRRGCGDERIAMGSDTATTSTHLCPTDPPARARQPAHSDHRPRHFCEGPRSTCAVGSPQRKDPVRRAGAGPGRQRRREVLQVRGPSPHRDGGPHPRPARHLRLPASPRHAFLAEPGPRGWGPRLGAGTAPSGRCARSSRRSGDPTTIWDRAFRRTAP